MDIMEDLEAMDIARFKLMSTDALKIFLSLRGLNVEGSHATLASRAFAAWERKVPLDIEAEERHRLTLKEYSEKLQTDYGLLPGPFSFDPKSWLGELKGGLEQWPSLYYFDISKFLDHVSTAKELVHRLDCEYKEGKGYRYFTSSFVKEVYWHPIDDDMPLCFLKCKVTPSQNTSKTPYNVWALVTKDQPMSAGGQIRSAYCSCTAGLLGSCNHVVAMLFRVEEAVSGGYTKPTCTDRLAAWPVPPSTKQLLELKPFSELTITKSHYQKSRDTPKVLEASNACFRSFSSKHPNELSDSENDKIIRGKLYEALQHVSKNSRFVEIVEKKKKRDRSDINIPSSIPLSIMEALETFHANLPAMIENVLEFTKIITLSDQQIDELYLATKDQASSSLWHEQRKGRITASKFHYVKTRTETMMKNPAESPAALIKSLIERPKFETRATKHGIAMESHAIRKLVSILKKSHTGIERSTPGLRISKGAPFLGASPDLEISCKCTNCQPSIAEIKCPYSIVHTIPSADTLDYLVIENGETKLKKSHKYFTQIQGQLGITNRKSAYFFVYTRHGYHMEKIDFDSDYWKYLEDHLVYFWYNYLAPSIIQRKNLSGKGNNGETMG